MVLFGGVSGVGGLQVVMAWFVVLVKFCTGDEWSMDWEYWRGEEFKGTWDGSFVLR